jgi:hypothetical protein
MLFDELQKTWQSQARARISVPPDVLLAELRRNQRQLKSTLFWRDFREVFVAAALAVFFFVQGLRGDGWTWILMVAASIWVGGFILIDRFRRRRRAASFGDSIRGCVDASLHEIEHQIWLLKNVLWWYLLPPFVAIEFSFAESAFDRHALTGMLWVAFGLLTAFCLLVFAGVYWLNQWAVRTELQPRRQELLAVRESLAEGGGRRAEGGGPEV